MSENQIIVRLHADGINDDTEALQAFIDGRILGRIDGKPYNARALEPGEYIAI